MSYKSTFLPQWLWHNNSALVQLLGLCPLLAVSVNAVQAVGLGLATTLVLICTNLVISTLRRAIPQPIRIPIYVMIIASVTSSVQLLMQAFMVNLYQALGVFIPLIVTNCTVIGRAEAFAAKHPPLSAAVDGLTMGLGASGTLLLLGSLRELLGSGTLFQGAEQLLGSWAQGFCLKVVALNHPFLLAILPPGAFLGLGLLLALKQSIDQHYARCHRTTHKTATIVGDNTQYSASSTPSP